MVLASEESLHPTLATIIDVSSPAVPRAGVRVVVMSGDEGPQLLSNLFDVLVEENSLKVSHDSTLGLTAAASTGLVSDCRFMEALLTLSH